MTVSTATSSFVEEWAKAQKVRGPGLKNAAIFYKNLEEELDANRALQACAMFNTSNAMVDFSSCDVVSLGVSGAVRQAFLDEFNANPDLQLGTSGTRTLNGNSRYIEALEMEIAEFHGVESALFIGSGALANEAIFNALVRPGDAIVYDEFVHASIHNGMKSSLALCQKGFRHNNVNDFVDTLAAVKESQPQIRNGQRSVLIAVESFYSMDGDVCPLKELVQAAKEMFPNGNAQFIVDEAHTSGCFGPQGKGFVSMLGLEKEIAVQNQNYGKAFCGSGAAILSNATVRRMLINHAKPVLYSVSPPNLIAASTRAGYQLIKVGKTQEAQDKVQRLVKLFLQEITENPIWDKANDAGFLRIPPHEQDDWDAVPFVSQVCPVWTKAKHNLYLAIHLQLAGFQVYPISFPIVPKGSDRVRLVFHGHNTEEEVRGLVASICSWAKETMECEAFNRRNGSNGQTKLCAAARYAQNLAAKAAMNGSA
ncbi:hypothetical protein F66182_8711 [Fusarium sp. NRRL 66182]|nr:hypothetical protein F66182_8711 [Fusarium sp. NRRL 66182]